MQGRMQKMVVSIKVSLSLSHPKTRGVGGFTEGERERALHASAVRVDYAPPPPPHTQITTLTTVIQHIQNLGSWAYYKS